MSTLSTYLKSCGKNVPGIKPRAFIKSITKIGVLTESTAGKHKFKRLTVGTAGSYTGKLNRIEADIDSLQYTSDGEFKTSGGAEQQLIMKLSKPRAELVQWLEQLKGVVACGAAIIFSDNNGEVFLWGLSGNSMEGTSRPVNSVQIATDSGMLITDEETQAVTLTFKRLSAFEPLLGNATAKASFAAGTTAYLNWA